MEPLIDGSPQGLFILDTGASGLVVVRQVADRVGMDAFGEMFVAGVGGKVREG